MHRILWIAVAVSGLPGLAQPPKPVVSPEVNPDRSVTFRLRAPNAKEVLLDRAGVPHAPMQHADDGTWTLTTDPLEPDFYSYSFEVDGVTMVDPSNPVRVPNLLSNSSEVHVPGPSSLPWELNDVPHGVIHHHFYRSEIIGDQRDYYVYTPPGYDPHASKPYPVLYLLHGYSDDASAWVVVGRANVELDNLIRAGKAKPMLIVMTLGYGAPEIVARFNPPPRDPSLRERNMSKFRQALLDEVIPRIDKEYHVAKDRGSRAIAGLSMGGAESLYTGLNTLDRFAWIGAFSSGGLGQDYNATFPALDAKAGSDLRLLWIACGTEDRLIEDNRKFRSWLDTKQIRHTDIETPGAHAWPVWRRNLAAFAPLLFQ
ncbi:MAG: alpha/beta hydrolase-fold protein [Bryobacteraceae bacterium]